MRTTLSHFVSEGDKKPGYSHLAIPSEVNRKRQARLKADLDTAHR